MPSFERVVGYRIGGCFCLSSFSGGDGVTSVPRSGERGVPPHFAYSIPFATG